MIPRRYLMVVALALAIGGCARVATNWDYDPSASFAGLRTYDWRPGSVAAWDDPRFDQALFDARLRTAVEKELGAKGYEKRTSSTPDFLVGYHAVVTREDELRTVERTQGYGAGPGPRYYGPQPGWRHHGRHAGWGGYVETETETRVYSYSQGTLILDIMDSRTGKLIWRGYAESAVDPAADPRKRQARIERIVAEILNAFPPE